MAQRLNLRRIYGQRLSESQNHRCAYCGIRFGAVIPELKITAEHSALTIDHVIPKDFGGSDSLSNLVAACFRCNQRKGNGDAWKFFLEKGFLTSSSRRHAKWVMPRIRRAEVRY